MLKWNTLLKSVAIVGANWLPICRFYTRNGPQENRTSLFSIRLFILKDILGKSTAVRNYLTALRKQIGQESHPRRYYPPVSQKKKQHQRTALSSRRATWLVLRKPETRSAEDQQLLLLLQQAHPQVKTACELAQAFVQMIRERNASVLEPWLKEATESEVPELRTFAKGIKHDQDAIHAALTYEWSQGQVEGQVHRLKLLKRQSYGRAGFGLLRHRVLIPISDLKYNSKMREVGQRGDALRIISKGVERKTKLVS